MFRLEVNSIGQFSFPEAQRNTIPFPRRPPVTASDFILLTTLDDQVSAGDIPHELERASTLSLTKLSTVKNLSSLMNKPSSSLSHLIGSSRHPGAAPTTNDASTSAPVTPLHAVP